MEGEKQKRQRGRQAKAIQQQEQKSQRQKPISSHQVGDILCAVCGQRTDGRGGGGKGIEQRQRALQGTRKCFDIKNEIKQKPKPQRTHTAYATQLHFRYSYTRTPHTRPAHFVPTPLAHSQSKSKRQISNRKTQNSNPKASQA